MLRVTINNNNNHVNPQHKSSPSVLNNLRIYSPSKFSSDESMQSPQSSPSKSLENTVIENKNDLSLRNCGEPHRCHRSQKFCRLNRQIGDKMAFQKWKILPYRSKGSRLCFWNNQQAALCEFSRSTYKLLRANTTLKCLVHCMSLILKWIYFYVQKRLQNILWINFVKLHLYIVEVLKIILFIICK